MRVPAQHIYRLAKYLIRTYATLAKQWQQATKIFNKHELKMNDTHTQQTHTHTHHTHTPHTHTHTQHTHT